MEKNKWKILIFFMMIGIFTICYFCIQFMHTQDISVKKDESVQISNKMRQNYEDDLNEKNEIIQSIMQKTNSKLLLEDQVRKIYHSLKDENMCISDLQGDYNLYGKENFLKFWENYRSKKNGHLIHYTLSITGELSCDDFIYQDGTLFLMSTGLYYDEQKVMITDTSSWIIEEADYDSYGYFSYKKKVTEKPFDLGNITYGYFRVDPIEDRLRTYTKTYIEPVEYDCNNLFVTEWDKRSMDTISFNDLIIYLFPLCYQDETFQSYLRVSDEPYISYIDADFFENLVRRFFEIDQIVLRQKNHYCSQEHAYPYLELYCIASHTVPPKLRPEVVEAKQKGDILELTVHATGYEKGVPLAFTHIVSLKLLDNGDFHYLSNKIVANPENKLPKFSPRITNDSMILSNTGCS